MTHHNIPVFIPHYGCPFRCVFCDQKAITGQSRMTPEIAKKEIQDCLSTMGPGEEAEIAFFGGTFTGLPADLQTAYLDLAAEYVRNPEPDRARVTGIRMSTRPDFITGEVIRRLSRYPVSAVELGIQSLDDRVLDTSGRGHSARRSLEAAGQLMEAGIPWVAQLMVGLPGSTPESEIQSAQTVCDQGASAARIYPVVVFAGTELAERMRDGEYTPLSEDEAVTRGASMLRIFRDRHVPVLRIGLCASEQLTDPASALGGPNHPALGDLIRSRLLYEEAEDAIRSSGIPEGDSSITLDVPWGTLSLCIGQNRRNLKDLKRKFALKHIYFRECGTETVTVSVQDSRTGNGGQPCT